MKTVPASKKKTNIIAQPSCKHTDDGASKIGTGIRGDQPRKGYQTENVLEYGLMVISMKLVDSPIIVVAPIQ